MIRAAEKSKYSPFNSSNSFLKGSIPTPFGIYKMGFLVYVLKYLIWGSETEIVTLENLKNRLKFFFAPGF